MRTRTLLNAIGVCVLAVLCLPSFGTNAAWDLDAGVVTMTATANTVPVQNSTGIDRYVQKVKVVHTHGPGLNVDIRAGIVGTGQLLWQTAETSGTHATAGTTVTIPRQSGTSALGADLSETGHGGFNIPRGGLILLTNASASSATVYLYLAEKSSK